MRRAVFVDANVLISGSASSKGASNAILRLGELGLIQLVASRQVIEETERNIRLQFPDILPYIGELLGQARVKIVADPLAEDYARWFEIIEEKDAPILEAAVQASVDYLITLNTKDFTQAVSDASGLPILTPAAFIEKVRDLLLAYL
jgi:predicted nucleic acid-binding protein